MRSKCAAICIISAAVAVVGCGKKDDAIARADKKDVAAGVPAPSIAETKAIAEEAYLYGFPMIAAYKAMYEFNVDKSSSQYKSRFNEIWNDSKTITPKDTAIVTPNADTPYSMLQADLRAEPVVFCVPAVDKKRYYSVQLAALYSFNYGYVGSRTTGNDGGCYMIAGPNWKGDKPEGIAKVFNSETQFSFVIFRTQLFNAADIENVKKIQASYNVKPLSAFLKQPAPPAAPTIDFPRFAGDDPSRRSSLPISTSCCSSHPKFRRRKPCGRSSRVSALARARNLTSRTCRSSTRPRSDSRSRRRTARSRSGAIRSARTSTGGSSAHRLGIARPGIHHLSPW